MYFVSRLTVRTYVFQLELFDFTVSNYRRLPFNCGVKLLRFATMQADCGSKIAFFGNVTFFMALLASSATLSERPVSAVAKRSDQGAYSYSMCAYRLLSHEQSTCH